MRTRSSPEPAAGPGTTADDGLVLRLSAGRRAWRAGVLLALAGVFLAGSVVGQDSWWPFGPWRMFSTSNPVTGSVIAMAVQVRTADDPQWRDAPLSPRQIGLNRAEVEGRIGQIAADPEMLATLADSHARLQPDAPRWTAARLVRRETVIKDRVPTGEVRETVIAEWAGP